MNCYFCKTKLKYQSFRPLEQAMKYNLFDHCENCEKLYGVKVHTMNGLKEHTPGQYDLEDDGELQYVHIYIDERTIIDIPCLGSLSFCRSHLVFGHNYHIRLHLREGFTNVADPTDSEPNDLFKVPGFPFRPDNAKEKLKLYLLFS